MSKAAVTFGKDGAVTAVVGEWTIVHEPDGSYASTRDGNPVLAIDADGRLRVYGDVVLQQAGDK